jgi:hypothetical protein
MSNGIEYREIEGIMDAYSNGDNPNFSIWAGKSLRVKYEGCNVDEGSQMLRNYLNTIQQSNTQTVYTLRVYHETKIKISSNTDYDGSLTFMLSPTAPVRIENGLTVIDRTPGTAAQSNNPMIAMLQQELQEQRKLNEAILAKLHNAELDNLKEHFENRINGLNTPEKPDMQDRLIGMLDRVIEKPDLIRELFNGLGTMVDRFRPGPGMPALPEPQYNENIFETRQQPGAINGTGQGENKRPMHTEDDDTDYSRVAGAFTDNNEEFEPDGQEEEEELTPEQQQLLDRMDDALDILEQKIGTENLVVALENLAAKSTTKLKALLMMM